MRILFTPLSFLFLSFIVYINCRVLSDNDRHSVFGEINIDEAYNQMLGGLICYAKLHLFDLFCICCTTSCTTKSTTNPQQIE